MRTHTRAPVVLLLRTLTRTRTRENIEGGLFVGGEGGAVSERTEEGRGLIASPIIYLIKRNIL